VNEKTGSFFALGVAPPKGEPTPAEHFTVFHLFLEKIFAIFLL